MQLLLLIISLFISSPLRHWNPDILNFAKDLQGLCIQALPHSQYVELKAALVCGQSLTNPYFIRLFSETGLIHLLVVSGSHLLLLCFALESLSLASQRTWIKFLVPMILLLYALLTGLQAPVLRALLGLGLRSLSQKLSLHWPEHFVVLSSVGFCLSFFPEWLSSHSLLMSALASLALGFPYQFSLRNKTLWTSLFSLIFLAPTLLSFGTFSFQSIIFNILLAPVLGLLLFPLAAANLFLPLLVVPTDKLLSLLIALLQTFNQADGQNTLEIRLPTWLIWSELLSLCLFVHLFSVYIKRRTWQHA